MEGCGSTGPRLLPLPRSDAFSRFIRGRLFKQEKRQLKLGTVFIQCQQRNMPLKSLIDQI